MNVRPPVALALALGPLLSSSGLSCSGGVPDDAIPAPDPAVTRAALEQHVGFLAGEDLRGREAATPDSIRAARYLARCLAAAGIQPAPDQPSHMIEVPLLRFEHLAPPRMILTTAAGQTFEPVFGPDFRVVIRGEARSTPVLPIRRADRKTPLPEEVQPDEALFLVGTPRDRSAWLFERGMGDGSGWGLDLQVLDRDGGDGAVAEPPRPRLVTDLDEEDVCEIVYVRGPLRERLLANEFASIQITFEERRTELVDYNVLGVIPGADPDLAQEVVLFFTSFDGLGYHEPKNAADAPRLRAGADDNASSCAALLELAEALAAGPAPKRTLAFLFLTGDKQRRFGLERYLEHPLIPLERTLIALHLERFGRPAEGQAGKLWLTGFRRTDLGPSLVALGLDVEPDTDTFAKNFMRADSFSFAVEGIVAQTISGSDWSVDAPFEDTPDRIAYDHLETCTLALERIGQALADGSLTPGWGEKGPPELPTSDDDE